MGKLTSRTRRLGVATGVLWLVAAVVAWLTIEPNVNLVGAKKRGLQGTDLMALQRTDLASERTLLEKTRVWPMERDGLPPVVKAPVLTIEKKIVWSIAATVVRPKLSYLLVQDQETKAITQINIGDALPDGSKLLQVSIGSYVVRTNDGKKRTVDTSL
jgi:hypothetical protein